jgi:murein DD-endopeptidase MepM/ murein hydrolase activator NlpD
MRTTVAVLSAALVGACSSPAPVHYPHGKPLRPQGAETPVNVPEQGPFQPNLDLYVCNMRMSNRPDTMPDRRVRDFAPLIVVHGVVLASVPANDVCVTSGFGQRNGRAHKGLDLQSRPAGTIYSAAPGTIVEVSTLSGFGNQVLISHGSGVYTRYAHLAYFASGLHPGQAIGFGQPLGMMGDTGNATAVHLHYEILTGNYHTPKKAWGLKANDPLTFPAWSGLDELS